MWGDYWFLDTVDQIQQFDEAHRLDAAPRSR
jgi:unsaturated chondroitin disaccharide hydrolase